MLTKIREYITYCKMFMQRAISWVALANAGMILFLFLAKLQDFGLNIQISQWYVPIFLATLVAMTLFGFLEDKLGFHKEEQELCAQRNPYYDKILNRITELENKIDKVQEDVNKR